MPRHKFPRRMFPAGSDTEAKEPIPVATVTRSEDQERENHQMCKSLGVLRAVDGAHAEGKESGKNSGDGGIRTRAGAWRNPHG